MSNVKIDTSKFNAMCRDLAKISGNDLAHVVDYEVARVLEKTIQYLPAANVSKIRANQEAAPISAQPDTLYTPKTAAGLRARARAKRTKKEGKLKYWLANKYPDDLWAAIVAARKKSLQARIKARGLAKRSFLNIAKMLGLEVRSPAYVGKAVPSTGKEYPWDESVRRSVTAGHVGIWIENAQPTANIIGGAGALQRAIKGRLKFFEKNVEKKVFDSVKAVAKKYPGVKING